MQNTITKGKAGFGEIMLKDTSIQMSGCVVEKFMQPQWSPCVPQSDTLVGLSLSLLTPSAALPYPLYS